MVDRIKAAVDARSDPTRIMARTDALAVEGWRRPSSAQAYVAAGADMLFPEAITELGMYRRFAEATQVPILANITESARHRCLPLTSCAARVDMALYPLSAFRAMNRAAERVCRALRERARRKASSTPCRPATSCTKASTTICSKRNSTLCSLCQRDE